MLDPKLSTEDRQQIPEKQEYKFIGSMRKRKGLTLFAWDPDKGQAYPVELKSDSFLNVNGKLVTKHKAQINPEHTMVWSLNKQNAIKKFIRFINQQNL